MALASEGAVAWRDVARRLEGPRNYWLVTIDPDGAPHAAPVWGALHGGSLYCFATRTTRKARNLARDDRALVHLEDGDRVVIVHGRLVDVGEPAASPGVVGAFAEKYPDPKDQAYLPSVEPDPEAGYVVDVLYRLEPERAVMWTLADFDASQRRWHR